MWRMLMELIGRTCDGQFHDWETARSVDRADIYGMALDELDGPRRSGIPSRATTMGVYARDRACLRCGKVDRGVARAVEEARLAIERSRYRERLAKDLFEAYEREVQHASEPRPAEAEGTRDDAALRSSDDDLDSSRG